MTRVAPPRVLSIAGSDSGGGAGVQADLKTFAAHRVYGMTAVTAVTAQNTVAVTAVHVLPADIVAAQIDAVFEDIGVDAVKIGMLANPEIVRVVAERLRAHSARQIVLDPVMIAKSGDDLLATDAVVALRDELLPLATLVTPNLPEAERLSGLPVASIEDRMRTAADLGARGPQVLIKGGHGEGTEITDLLYGDGTFERFVHRRIDSEATHGTGCTLSSAIAARLAKGDAVLAAVGGAIRYLQRAIADAYPLGGGHGPVNHLHNEDRLS